MENRVKDKLETDRQDVSLFTLIIGFLIYFYKRAIKP